MTREEAIYFLTQAAWEESLRRALKNSTTGFAETLPVMVEAATALLATGIQPDEIMQAVKNWASEPPNDPAHFRKAKAEWWKHAVSDAVAALKAE